MIDRSGKIENIVCMYVLSVNYFLKEEVIVIVIF